MAGDSTRMKFEQVCNDCGESAFVDDHSAGDLICTNCGLVAESRCIDERSEWRTFGDKDGTAGADPNRVGGPTNHLLSNDLATDIGQGRGTATLAQALKRTAFQNGGDPDKALSMAFKRIKLLCDNLGLLKNHYDTACELYKEVSDAKVVKGRAIASVIPAIVYIACRREQNPRTFKEILSIATDTTKKDVARSFNNINKNMGDAWAAGQSTAHVKDFMRRFCNQLGLKHQDVVVAEEFALAACPRDGKHINGGVRPWDGKSPLSLAAAILLITTRMPKATRMPDTAEIAEVAQVADVTVRTTAHMMLPFAKDFFPATYASPDQIRKTLTLMASMT